VTNSLKNQLGTLETEHIKSNIERIISSYRHVWDIYTELLQNAADAIYDKFGDENSDKGSITLKLLPKSRTIIVEDNGVGISEDNLSKILVNGKSIKRELNSGKYGFMGFGFTYIAFQSEMLIIESVKDGIKASRTYVDLYKFIYEEGPIPNSFEEENNFKSEAVTSDSGTKIIIKFPLKFTDDTIEQNLQAAFRIANHTDILPAVLRTKTVIGLLDPIFDNKPTFGFNLFLDGAPVSIKTGYLTTREIVKSVVHSESQFYEMSVYEQLIKITEIITVVTSQDQARKAILVDIKMDDVQIGDRNPLLARFHLTSTSKSLINSYNEKFTYGEEKSDFKIEHGVWLSIAGMPIGVCLDAFDHSNYLPFTVLVDIKDTSIRKELDAGRKGISSYRMYQIAEKARELLVNLNFIKYRRYVVGGSDTRISDPLYDPKKDLADRLVSKTRTTSDLVQKFLPPYDEQEVISLFTELVCKGILKGYLLKILSGYAVYDGLLEYNINSATDTTFSETNKLGISKFRFDNYSGNIKQDNLFVEFKTKFRSIYRDIETNKKDLSHIDILICWDTEFECKDTILQEKGDLLVERDHTQNIYYGATHQLIGSNRKQPLTIIELKSVLKHMGVDVA